MQHIWQQIISLQRSNTSAVSASSILVSIWNNQPSTVLISAVLWIVQVESSREANTQALQELSAKLQREYEEKLQEERRKHREEIENLQVCILYTLFIHVQFQCQQKAKRTCQSEGWMDVWWLLEMSRIFLGFDTLIEDCDAAWSDP